MSDPNQFQDRQKGPGKDKPNDDKRKKKPFNRYIKQPRFEGACAEMKGYVFDCLPSKTKQADKYTKTIEMLKTYAGRNYSSNVTKAITNLTRPTLTEPNRPADPNDVFSMKIWDRKLQMYLNEERDLDEHLRKLYSLIWGQCSEAMKTRLQETDRYDTVSANMDSLGLLEVIRGLVFQYRTNQHPILAMHDIKCNFYKKSHTRETTDHPRLLRFVREPGGNMRYFRKLDWT